jgi:predicted DNA-binding transcriptional regulator YafY
MPAPSEKMTRPPFERIKQIHSWLVAGKYPNCAMVAGRFEVSSRTIQRDFDYMRDRLNLPIAYDSGRRGFHYTEEVDALPTVQMPATEWTTLLVARKAIEQYRGSPWSPQMDEILKKLSANFDELLASSGVEAAVSFRNTGAVVVEDQVFRDVCDAVVQRRAITFRYRKYSTARSDRRRVHPYHLSCVNGSWYLVALNLERGLIRVYGLERIHELSLTRDRFERPPDFSASSYFGKTFGVITEEGELYVSLRFRPPAAWRVKQRLWHPSQTLIPLPGDAIEMRFAVSSLREVVTWVLSWGDDVTVLGPSELLEQIAAQARRVAALYPPEGEPAPPPQW